MIQAKNALLKLDPNLEDGAYMQGGLVADVKMRTFLNDRADAWPTIELAQEVLDEMKVIIRPSPTPAFRC